MPRQLTNTQFLEAAWSQQRQACTAVDGEVSDNDINVSSKGNRVVYRSASASTVSCGAEEVVVAV
jgi:hypothetical protein